MTISQNLVLLILITNLILIYKFNFFSKIYGLYDFPNESRKKQLNPVSLFGGFIILINILIYIFYEISIGNKEFFFIIGAKTNLQITTFCLSVLSFFFIGFLDDKLNLKPLSKIFCLLVILLIFFSVIERSVINELVFYNYQINIDLFQLGIPFTILCILVLTNALNMMDGIDLVSFIYFIFIFLIFVLNNYLVNFSLTIIVGLLFFAFLNIKGKTYLGDSGVYLLSFLVSIHIISFYENNRYSVEDILIILSLPVIDFIRLFILRILKRRSPFLPDRNHFHHILNSKFNKFNTILIFSMMVFIPTFLNMLLNINPIFILIGFIFTYFVIINWNKKKI